MGGGGKTDSMGRIILAHEDNVVSNIDDWLQYIVSKRLKITRMLIIDEKDHQGATCRSAQLGGAAP